ncbi:hypothetical protein GCM10028820_29030 [Tessaracoccus terricola]
MDITQAPTMKATTLGPVRNAVAAKHKGFSVRNGNLIRSRQA